MHTLDKEALLAELQENVRLLNQAWTPDGTTEQIVGAALDHFLADCTANPNEPPRSFESYRLLRACMIQTVRTADTDSLVGLARQIAHAQ